MINLIPVAKSVGSNRMVSTVSIPYPLGNPALSQEDQYSLRYGKVGIAIDSLTKEIDTQTVFR